MTVVGVALVTTAAWPRVLRLPYAMWGLAACCQLPLLVATVEAHAMSGLLLAMLVTASTLQQVASIVKSVAMAAGAVYSAVYLIDHDGTEPALTLLLALLVASLTARHLDRIARVYALLVSFVLNNKKERKKERQQEGEGGGEEEEEEEEEKKRRRRHGQDPFSAAERNWENTSFTTWLLCFLFSPALSMLLSCHFLISFFPFLLRVRSTRRTGK